MPYFTNLFYSSCNPEYSIKQRPLCLMDGVPWRGETGNAVLGSEFPSISVLVVTSLIDLIRLLKLQMQLVLEYILILTLCGTIRYLNGKKKLF